MDVRKHTTTDAVSEVLYSDCGAYRYFLSRRWSDTGGLVNFIMLNPSKADEFRNDPTVERCERRARQLGFGAFAVTNIFAWRATDPKDMRRADHPEGPDNRKILLNTARTADLIIAAWGAHGDHRGQGETIKDLLRQAGLHPYHLGLSKHGHPRHPLYVAYARQPDRWF